jgi:hypothetical protein
MTQPNPETALSQMERDRLAVYVAGDQLGTPWWYWPFIGLAVGVNIAGADLPKAAAIAISLTAAVAIGVVVGRIVARSGFMPKLRGMPTPLRRPLIAYWIVCAVPIGAVAAAHLVETTVPFAVLGAVSGLVIALAGWLTERRYIAIAKRLADEAGLTT